MGPAKTVVQIIVFHATFWHYAKLADDAACRTGSFAPSSPMHHTVFGNDTFVSFVHPANAAQSIVCTPFGTATLVTFRETVISRLPFFVSSMPPVYLNAVLPFATEIVLRR